MTDTLTHRGPDDDGYHVTGPVGLGHRRLSIIDLASGDQPMTNEDRSVWVIFNGEIYNYRELRRGLAERGHLLATESDTEVIVHLYEELGAGVFAELRGMFSIAIWDERRQKLLLARDRVGKKPLFYLHDGTRLAFASELKALHEIPGLSLDLDLEAVSDYFSLGYIPVPKSIYRQVRKVHPGHYLVVTDEGIRETEYWDIDFGRTEIHSEEEWCGRLLEAYRDAVRIRLRSDVPLGAFLSGGVDSSSVVALMSEMTADPVITASIGFGEADYDELTYAGQVASRLATDHHEEVLEPDATAVIDRLVWHYDEPFADSSAVPTYYVSRVARKHVTVALSGDGGDENFGGYRRYYFDKQENRVRSVLPGFVKSLVVAPLGFLWPKADWAPRIFRGKVTLQNIARPHVEGYFRSMSVCRPDLKRRLLHPDARRRLGDYDSADVFRRYYDRADTDDPVSRIQYVDIKTYLTDDILVKVDRASMAVSLEVRAPILDHLLMELVARMPSSLKVNGTKGKYLFKKSLRGLVSDAILDRRKMGFAVPLADWFRGDLKETAHRAIVGRPPDGLLDERQVGKVWDQHQSGLRDRSQELWAILMFRLWQDRFEASG
jgi:asparagine synthase (glutamine-hydrolysing)